MKYIRSRHSPSRGQRGMYAVEFALVFLIFFAVLYGILSYGMLLAFRMGLQNAAEDGARAALRYQLTLPARATRAVDIATQRTSWMPAAMKPLAVTAEICRVEGAEATRCAPDNCVLGTDWTQRCQIVVTVKADKVNQLLPPILSLVFPSQIVGKASMLFDGRPS